MTHSESGRSGVLVAGDADTGAALLDVLRARLRDTDFHRLVAIVTLRSDASVRFDERRGFVHRGTRTEAGFTSDRYLDVAYDELAL